MNDNDCAGVGKCHGCMDWCADCGEVRHICDTRLRGERCDQHPVPSSAAVIRRAKEAAHKKIAEGRRLQQEGIADLHEAIDAENARREYDRQIAALDDAMISQSARRVP